MPHFTASDGIELAYTIDDFTDPWKQPATLVLLHAAMGHAGRFFAWVPRLARHYRVSRWGVCLPHQRQNLLNSTRSGSFRFDFVVW